MVEALLPTVNSRHKACPGPNGLSGVATLHVPGLARAAAVAHDPDRRAWSTAASRNGRTTVALNAYKRRTRGPLDRRRPASYRRAHVARPLIDLVTPGASEGSAGEAGIASRAHPVFAGDGYLVLLPGA